MNGVTFYYNPEQNILKMLAIRNVGIILLHTKHREKITKKSRWMMMKLLRPFYKSKC